MARLAAAGAMLSPRRLATLTLLGLLAVAATASAHTTEICWKDSGGVTTFYAGSYHSPAEGPSPVGDIIVDGFSYPFSGYILPAALPADVQCFACTASTPGSLGTPSPVVHYQTFTSGFALASHTISFDTSTNVQTPWCNFPPQTFGGGACADADFDGQCNDVDPCPLDAANDGDGDGLCADVDNCPLVANADQADVNMNGQGDACEGVVCGNGLQTPPEQCDDGNIAGGDGCSAICTLEASCGNGAVELGETCDDGNTSNGDCCSSSCQYEAATSTCGDPSDTECSNPDSCDGAGACLANDESSGASCGDAGTECIAQDTCNGSGSCIDNGFVAAGIDCGSPSDTECTDRDTCDGAGACLANDAASGSACGDAGSDCVVQDTCDGSGGCSDNGYVSAGTGCGSASNTDCTNPDTCDGTGTCLANHESANTACTPDNNDCSRDVCDGGGACAHPFKPDDSACDDDNICTQADACSNGVCGGNNTGADTDGDGYCDLFENQQGCNAGDSTEIPPQAPTYGGTGSNRANVLVTYSAPSGSKVAIGTDPSCAAAGVCGPPPPGFVTGFCLAGRIGDACTTDAECNLPAGTCRLVVNYADVPDLVLDYAFLNRRGNAIAGFNPVTPGCSRKVDLTLGTSRTNRVRIKAHGTVYGRPGKDRETFSYR